MVSMPELSLESREVMGRRLDPCFEYPSTIARVKSKEAEKNRFLPAGIKRLPVSSQAIRRPWSQVGLGAILISRLQHTK